MLRPIKPVSLVEKREHHISARTNEPVKSAIRAEARRLGLTESEAVHYIVSHYFGLHPRTGRRLHNSGLPDGAVGDHPAPVG